MMQHVRTAALMVGACLLIRVILAQSSHHPFFIRVIDEETERGVPLVELRTANEEVFITDSAGIAAITDQSLNGVRVRFAIRSHGYVYPNRIFDEPAVVLKVERGRSETVKVQRTNIAERLYRITGAGVYRDSLLAGLPVPTRRPLINAEVLGQDTAITALYGGKIFWCWGDTLLGAGFNFSASCATSELPSRGGLDPDRGVDLTYFVDKQQRSKPMLPLGRRGLVWLEGLFTVPDPSGRERLMATYTRQDGLKPPDERGIAVFDDERAEFRVVRQFPADVHHVSSHPFRHAEGGRPYWYLYPNFRVADDWNAIQRPEAYESYTCLRPGARFDKRDPSIERDPNGRPIWAWKSNTGRLLDERALVEAGIMTASDTEFPVVDLDLKQPTYGGVGSVAWNEYRRKWIMIFSRFGDVSYSEADRPEGPWLWSKKIITHDHYTFYNPVYHPFFDKENGRVIYLEGTYTDAFSDAKTKTPLYNYNQIMYRLRLDDPRLRPVQ